MIGTRFSLALVIGLVSSLALAAAPALAAPTAVAAWHQQATPSPGGTAVLWGVSCIAPYNCQAVGSFTSNSGMTGPFGEAWNGSSWYAEPAGNARGSDSASLYAISCKAGNGCLAVGTAQVNGNHQMLAERWNGTGYTVVATPLRSESVLESASCQSVRMCMAVGLGAGGRSDVPLAELWNGRGMVAEAVPTPKSSVNSAFYGVSCPTVISCYAVGMYQDSSYRTQTLTEHWNGQSWTMIGAQNMVNQGDVLAAVSCSSPTSCVAVGSSTARGGIDVAMSEQLSGASWRFTARQLTNPTGAILTSPLGVSCASADLCAMVGDASISSTEKPVAEAWTGSSWALQSVAASNPSFSDLDAVSCASTIVCSAVGSNGGVTLGEGYR